MEVRQIIAAPPAAGSLAGNALGAAIEECLACSQVCLSCADACLAEAVAPQVRLCIQFNLVCADLCSTAARVAARHAGVNETIVIEILNACALACRLSADACERHAASMECCRVCADACNRCEEACSVAICSIRRECLPA